MTGDFEATPIRLYFHCGWAVQVDPTFESELLYGGETLRMWNPGERREVYLSSTKFTRYDGQPLTVEHVTSVFPPPEMTGIRYEHRNGEIGGAGLWMFGEDDQEPEPCWVLMAMMVSPSENKLARCTVVCLDEADRDWAVATWRSVVRADPPARKAPREGRG